MLKIRRPLGRLIFNMGIAIPCKTVFLIETAPWPLWNSHRVCRIQYTFRFVCFVFNIITDNWIGQIAKTLGSTSTRYRSDTFASDRCLIDVAPSVFAIWEIFLPWRCCCCCLQKSFCWSLFSYCCRLCCWPVRCWSLSTGEWSMCTGGRCLQVMWSLITCTYKSYSFMIG